MAIPSSEMVKGKSHPGKEFPPMKKTLAFLLSLLLMSMTLPASAAQKVLSVVHPKYKMAGSFIEDVQRKKRAPEGYIPISTPAEFCKIGLNPAANYILMADIDLKGQAHETITGFSGILDGNGYTVSNPATTLINTVKGGCVMNLGLRANLLEANAGLVGYAAEGATIFNCWFDGSIVNANLLSMGGIAYRLEGSSIVSCYNKASLRTSFPDNAYSTREAVCGGIVASLEDNAIVCNCINMGSINAGDNIQREQIAGGIVGMYDIATGDGSYSRVLHCRNDGPIYGKHAAGIIGGVYITRDYATLYTANCFNAGAISAAQYSGGILNVRIIEKGSVVVQDCYNIGSCPGSGIVGGEVQQRSFDLLAADLMNVRIERCFNYAASEAGVTGLCKNLDSCYYLDRSPRATLDGALFTTVRALSAKDMAKQKSFAGFDFDETWQMGKQHPVFRNTEYPEYVY